MSGKWVGIGFLGNGVYSYMGGNLKGWGPGGGVPRENGLEYLFFNLLIAGAVLSIVMVW